MIKRAISGDKDALVRVITLRKEEYYRLAYVYMKNSHDAMDVLEDVIVILYENINKLKKVESFSSWSKTILVNCCKKQLKKKERLVLKETVEGKQEREDIDRVTEEVVINRALEKLKPKHSEVIKLRYFMDMEYKCIARVLRIPEGTVKSRLAIGMRKLKEILGGDYK
ncbi:sigma-70 family RNA polymerase sigma factor [Oceanirhabdus seepicola]|uniref:sigma-70 family RNA polymerase sigma factor n=1 Tax=Oceanirhabdus seepicola TaxID=2828781 RepID=UPI002032DACC|nr:sigma-70 family RNA polymerase sigma factor [Oceanirhabdus seepicola]